MKSLVVDDDLTSRFLLQEILSSYGVVHTCVDGAEAVRAAQMALEEGRAYDLICLDILMPVLGGLEALRQIRDLEEDRARTGRSSARILMTTAVDDVKSVTAAFAELCDGYLVKPFSPSRLRERLEGFGLYASGADAPARV